MKQFNLEEYLKNPSRKVVTRDGRSVRIRCTDQKGTLYKVIGLVDNGDKEAICNFTSKGESCFGVETNIDLFFAPEKHEGWLNIYKSQGRLALFTCGLRYDSEEEARREARRNRDKIAIATVKCEWEE